jgi:hypothetical protein
VPADHQIGDMSLQDFAWEAVLEALIIVILLAELGVTLYEAFAP